MLGLYGMHVGSFKMCCEILLLLNMADIRIVFYLEGCGVSSAEYRVHLSDQ